MFQNQLIRIAQVELETGTATRPSKLKGSADFSSWKNRIKSFFELPLRLNIREPDICVIQSELPLSVFVCKTLTDLRLEPSAFDFKGWEFPSTIYLPCLKSLDVVGCQNPHVINGCPVLESLSLEVSCNDEENFILNIPTLKRLKLICRSGYSTVNDKIILRVPKLEYLFVDGVLCSLFEMEDMPSLVVASIACLHITFDFMWADSLNKLRGVQNLSIEKVGGILIPTLVSEPMVLPRSRRRRMTGSEIV
ncbi:putative leucine-rich repeat domain superfamily [Helianthus annuus]|nr:putative leucine-rich repeat domain superfamily [Helianthus annuus]